MESKDSVTQIIALAKGAPELLQELERFRRNIAVMFTDIKGSTSYFEKYGDGAGMFMVEQCNNTLRQIVERHGGRVIKTIGDAIMATFESCPESLVAAVEMQQALIEFNRPKPEEDHVSIRIGLNYGQGIVRSTDVFGDVVNVASRVESVAQPDQIIISDSLYREVSGTCPYPLRHAGRFAFKGKTSTHDVFEVVWNPNAVHETARAHTIVAQSGKAALVIPTFRLRHIKADGSEGSEQDVSDKAIIVGRAGDVSFPGDPLMEPQHARFSIERGYLFVEDIGAETGTGVFVRIAVPWPLQDGDVVMLGRQLLHFRANAAAVAAAAATGTTIVDMTHILDKPVAELVPLAGSARYPIVGDEVSFGRNKGTYVLPSDGYMSGQHARVYHRGEDFFLEDLGSRNGTFVKIRKKTPVPPDTMVRVGGQLFKVLE